MEFHERYDIHDKELIELCIQKIFNVVNNLYNYKKGLKILFANIFQLS